MTLFSSKNEFRFTLFYATVLLVSNVLVALLYLPVSYMQSTGSLFLIPIYYLERLFDLWLSVFSIAAILVMIVEPIIWNGGIASWITVCFMGIMTLWSGIDYMKSYAGFIDPNE